MVQITEAIFKNGVLQFAEPLKLAEQDRVRVTIEPLSASELTRTEAKERLKESLRTPFLNTGGQLPTREELHDRD